MKRNNPVVVGGMVVATFGAIWGTIEAASYFGLDWLRSSGPLGLAFLFSVAINAALAIRWWFRSDADEFPWKAPGRDIETTGDLVPGARLRVATIEGLAKKLAQSRRVDLFLAGGDSFYVSLSQALQLAKTAGIGALPDLRVLLRRSSTASARSFERYGSLEALHGIKVEVRWYDWDFMLRGCCFDNRFALFSFFLREGDKLTGRTNDLFVVETGRSHLDDFLLGMFNRTFEAHFERWGARSAEASKEPSYVPER